MKFVSTLLYKLENTICLYLKQSICINLVSCGNCSRNLRN